MPYALFERNSWLKPALKPIKKANEFFQEEKIKLNETADSMSVKTGVFPHDFKWFIKWMHEFLDICQILVSVQIQ